MNADGETHDSSSTTVRPSLMPSTLHKDSARSLSPHTEGYEGKKLHEIYMAARHREEGTGNEQFESSTVDEKARSFPAAQIEVKPFFVVIEDETTGEQHHPHVYYIFSDDDQDLITKAALRTLNPHNLGDSESEQLMQPHEERNIIVDMAADGQTVTSARSLSSSWQLSSYSVGPAPTFDDRTQQGQDGMMLRISGLQYLANQELQTSRPPSASSHEEGNEKLMTQIDALSRHFENDMAALQGLATQQSS